MVNIRTIKIDFTSENTLPEGSFLGYQGEHNATTLSVIPPAEMTECEEIIAYKVAFQLHNHRLCRSELIEKTSLVEVVLSAQITSSKEISVQLEGYGADGNLVVKSPKISKLMFEDSVSGTNVDYNAGEHGTAADVVANTLARHSHENGDILDKLNEDKDGNLEYNGKAIGNSGASGIYIGSGDMPDGYNVQIDPEGEADDLSEIVSAVIAALPKYEGEVTTV